MDESNKRKTYTSELRNRQKEQTRDLIMESVTSIIAEGRIHNFSVQDVADRAGISYGSMYRHFSTREALLESLFAWSDEKLLSQVQIIPKTLDEIPETTQKKMVALEDYPEHAIATVRTLTAMNIIPESVLAKDEKFHKIITGELPSLDTDFARQAASVIRYLSSSVFWMHLTTRFGFGPDEYSSAVTWALETLIKDLKARNEEQS
ncbi:TetR/AcrR family transcriptional regulator [Paenibacillus andongensis]|uniref:TetR/AcrR family transcriptional regulator n=1 Tax=Paenibacillus andongensis TaxID=2975482 RepID=UPI0021BAFD37|nr:TetR/AcrR family transcriptional regulator [Paenibacillus andongensis]